MQTYYIDVYLLCTVTICLQLILLSQNKFFLMIGSLEVTHELIFTIPSVIQISSINSIRRIFDLGKPRMCGSRPQQETYSVDRAIQHVDSLTHSVSDPQSTDTYGKKLLIYVIVIFSVLCWNHLISRIRRIELESVKHDWNLLKILLCLPLIGGCLV